MSKRMECEECEFEEYVDFSVFPSNSKKNWIKEFRDKENRFFYFCSKSCRDEFIGYEDFTRRREGLDNY